MILGGNFNTDPDSVEFEKDSEIAQLLAAFGLIDMNMNHHFTLRNRQTLWHQTRNRKVIQSRWDYFFCTDWLSIPMYSFCDPHPFIIDHKLVCWVLMSNTLTENKC